MKALVTGATGFLGLKLAMRLNQMGYEVTGSGRNPLIGQQLVQAGIRFLPTDLADETAMVQACNGQDVVFHCGALSSPWGPYRSFYESNVLGTRHVITGCKKHGVKRLIHVSTPSLYFHFRDQLEIHESDPLPPRFANHYAKTKWMAEQEVDRAFQQGLPVITIRPRALFGPGDNAILPRLLKANERGWVPLINGGQVLLDVTYVENVVDALLLCEQAPEAALGKKYNITNEEPVYLRDLLETLFQGLEQPFRYKKIPYKAAYGMASMMEMAARISGKEPTLTRYTVGVLGKSQTLDISAAKNMLGYQPKVRIEEGIEVFIRWWKKQTPSN